MDVPRVTVPAELGKTALSGVALLHKVYVVPFHQLALDVFHTPLPPAGVPMPSLSQVSVAAWADEAIPSTAPANTARASADRLLVRIAYSRRPIATCEMNNCPSVGQPTAAG